MKNFINFRVLLVALFGLMVLGVSEAYAGGTAYTRARAYLKAGSPTAGGKVYVSTSGTEASGSYKNCTSSTSPASSVETAGENKSTTYHFWAKANAGYKFTGWYSKNSNDEYTLTSTAAHYSVAVKSGSNPSSGKAYVDKDLYAGFTKIVQISFLPPTNGSFTITHNGAAVADYASFTVDGVVKLSALADAGYKLRGWYTTTNGGATKSYFDFSDEIEPTFSSNVTVGAEFVPDDGKATFWVQGTTTTYDNLTAANTAAASSSSKKIVVVSSGTIPAGTYTISSGVTLLIPYGPDYSKITDPNVIHVTSIGAAPAQKVYKKLTLLPGATINCSGSICVGGQMVAVNGGNPTSQVRGSLGVLDLSKGGTINLNSGAKLYAWGFVQGQNMNEGNNTSGVGEIVAKSGSNVYEVYQCGEWRGGTASSTIYNNRSSWKFFPFQSWTIQNIEAPITFQYGSTETCMWAIFGDGQVFTVKPVIIGSEGLFKLSSGASLKKWYDPTTDRVCYAMSGSAQLDKITLSALGTTITSSEYNLPIPANMHIVVNSGTTTISRPMVMHAGSVVEIKSGATLSINTNVYMFDKDDWDTYCMYAYYYRSYPNLTLHYNRGEGTAKTTLEDARLTVDGILSLGSSGRLYATTHGANVNGNGGGKIVYNSLPSSTTVTMCKVLKDNVSVSINAANMCNEDGSYTKAAASTTYWNVNGRWFVNGKQNPKSNHTYDFTYIKSGAVYGTGGTNATVSAVYSKDKTGLVDRMKWANVKADVCDDWWAGLNDSYFYNYTINSAWHQFRPTGTVIGEGDDALTIYSGSDNKLYAKSTECDWDEYGGTDANCLYTVSGVKKAFVNGSLVALTKNDADEAYHNTANASEYYICFSEGCNWHPATKVAGTNKAYTVSGQDYIWYNGAWLAATKDGSFYYSHGASNELIYYEYVSNNWTLAPPVAETTRSGSSQQWYKIADAVADANSGTGPSATTTIKLLRNITVSSALSYTGNGNTTLDLNGYTLTGTVTSMITINGTNSVFIVIDQSAGGTGKVQAKFSRSDNKVYGINVTKGHFIMNSGTVHVENTNASQGSCGVVIKTGHKFTMNGGTIESVSKGESWGVNTESTTTSTVTINGGTINTTTSSASAASSGIQSLGGVITVNGGTISTGNTTSVTVKGINLTNANSTLTIKGGTITTSAKNTDYSVYVTAGSTATIKGGTITATTTAGTARGVISYGTTIISGGTISATAGGSDAKGVYVANNTTTINAGATVNASATSNAYGIYYSDGAAPVVVVNGGTFNATTTSSTGAYGVYANKGTGTINGGDFNVTAKTAGAEGLHVETTNTPKLTVNGGKFMVKNSNGSAAGTINNTGATLANFTMAGGIYNVAPNGTTNIAAGKLVKDLDATIEASLISAGYTKKIAGQEYTVTWKSYNGKKVLKTEKVESGKVPVWSGTIPDQSTSSSTLEPNGWCTAKSNGGTTYPTGTPLPAIEAEDVTYFVYAKTVYAEVTADGTTTRYYGRADWWTAAMKKKQAYIKLLSNYSKSDHLEFTPTNDNSVITLDLNGHTFGNGTRTATHAYGNLINVNKAGCRLIITDNSASGNGCIYAQWANDATLDGVKVSNGELVLNGGTIKCINSYQTAQHARGVNVASTGKFTMTGGLIEVERPDTTSGGIAYGVYSNGIVDLSAGTIKATHKGDNQARGITIDNSKQADLGDGLDVRVAGNTTCFGIYALDTVYVNGGSYDVQADTIAKGFYMGKGTGTGYTSIDGTPSFSVAARGSVYGVQINGSGVTADVESGTFDVEATSGKNAYGAVSETSSTMNVKGGEFNVTLGGTTECRAAQASSSSTMNISGGTFTVYSNVTSNVELTRCSTGDATRLNISGGTFTMAKGSHAVSCFGGETRITGNPVFTSPNGLVAAHWASAAGTATAIVDGGTFVCTGWTLKSTTHTTGGKTVVGDVTVLDGKFKTTGSTVVDNTTSSYAYLKIKGGYFSNNASGRLSVYDAENNTTGYVESPSTVESCDTTIDGRNYTYHVKAQFSITWNDGTSDLRVDNLNRNEIPSYGSTPVHSGSDTYEFIGWSPEIAPATENVTYVAQWRKWEAEVIEGESATGTKFESFADAFNLAQNMPVAKIKILSNVYYGAGLTLNPDSAAGSKPLTIDLNNHIVNYTKTDNSYALTINKAGCKLIIDDSSVAKGGQFGHRQTANNGASISAIYIQNGELELAGGTIIAQNNNIDSSTDNSKGTRAVVGNSGTVFMMTGGKLYAKSRFDARAFNSDGNCTFNATGGTIEATNEYTDGGTKWGNNAYGVVLWNYGTFNMSGTASMSVTSATGALGVYPYGGGGSGYPVANISGGSINCLTKTGGGARPINLYGSHSKATISGGDITANGPAGQWNIECVYCDANATADITGGNFHSTDGGGYCTGVRVFAGTVNISGNPYFDSRHGVVVGDYATTTADATAYVNGGTFNCPQYVFYATSNTRDGVGTVTGRIYVNGGYFKTASGNNICYTGSGTSNLILNGGYYNETSGTTQKTNITTYKGATTEVSTLSPAITVSGTTYHYQLLTDFDVTWLGGSTYSKVEQVKSGTVPSNTELVGKCFIRNDSAFYFTGWSPTPTYVTGETTYEAVGDYYEAEVKIGSGAWTHYTDFLEAWDVVQANANCTIRLLSNFTLEDKILYKPTVANARTVFDLNNFTMTIGGTSTSGIDFNKADAVLTITDGSSAKGGKISMTRNTPSSTYTIYIYNGELKLTGGKIYVQNNQDKVNSSSWWPAIAVYVSTGTNAKLTMTGGTVESQAAYLAYALYNYGTTNISGGTVRANATATGNSLGIYAVNGTATISGGTFNITASSTAVAATATGFINNTGSVCNNGTLNITGGTFNVSATNQSAWALSTNGAGKTISGTVYKAHGVINVSGGTFNVSCPAATATQVFAVQCNGWRLFDEATPHAMVAEELSEMNISGGTFTVDTRNSGAWLNNGGNVDLLRCWGSLNVSGGTFTIYQYKTPNAIQVYRGKATVSGNPVFNVYSHTANARGITAAGWTHNDYCDKDATKNLAEAEINGGTFKIITEGQNTEGFLASGTTSDGGYAMNAKITVNGGTFLTICPNASGHYPIMLSSAADRAGTYGTATSEIYVNGGRFKSRKGTEADNTSTGAVNAHTTGNIWLTGGYYETNAQLSARVADTCLVTTLTSAEMDPEYANGYRYRIDVDYQAKVTVGAVERKFALFRDAFDYAKTQNNATITLLRDINYEGLNFVYNPSPAKSCTLDLNGFTFKGAVSGLGDYNDDRLLVINKAGATFTIKDSSVGKTGKWSHEKAGATFPVIVYHGKFVLQSGTVHGKNTSGGSVQAIRSENYADALVSVTGGKAHAETSGAAYGMSTYNKATISGGEIIAESSAGEAYGIYTNAAEDTTVISGGRIYAAGTNGYGVRSASIMTISGGKIIGESINTTGAAYGVSVAQSTTTITGADSIYAHATKTAYGVYSAGTGVATINGGQIISRNGDKDGSSITAYAINSGTININNGTLYAQRDGTGTANIQTTRTGNNAIMNITGGTFHAEGFQAVNARGGTTTVSGGTFYATTGLCAMDWADAATITANVSVTGGTFDCTGACVYVASSNSNNSGRNGHSEVTISGGKFKTTGSTIVQLDAPPTGADPSTLTITGGYFNEKSGTTYRGQVAGFVADTCKITDITSADIDPEYTNGYRYRVDVDYRVKVTHAAVEKKFVTLNQAFEYAKAQTNPTITLIGDANFTGPYSLNPTVANWQGILDLNNFTITSLQSASFADRYFTLNRSDIKLTVTDNSGAKGGVWNMVGAGVGYTYTIGIVVGLGELELAGGKIYVENNNASQSVTGINTWCSTINKAFYTQTGGTLEAKSAKSATAFTIYGATTISGGEVKATTTSGATARAFTLGVHDGIIGALTISGNPTITVNTATSDAQAIYSSTNGATATVSGGTFNVTSGTTNAFGVYLQTNPSTITISGGTFNITSSGDGCRGLYLESGNGTINVSGGTFNVTTATSGSESWYNIEGMRITYGTGTINCTGGTFNVTNKSKASSCMGVRNFAGTLNLSGTVEINANRCFYISDTYISEATAYVNISGGTFNSVSNCILAKNTEGTGGNAGKYTSSDFTVTGGKFKTTGANHIDGVTPTSALHLQGGYFNERSGTNSRNNLVTYVSDPYEVIDLDTDDAEYIAGYRYTVANAPVAKVKVGSSVTYHPTVASAFTAALETTDASTITMLKDASVTSQLRLGNADGRNCTLDLNGHTITSTSSEQYPLIVRTSGGSLTITDLTESKLGRLDITTNYTGTAKDKNPYGVYLYAGTLNLNAGTISVSCSTDTVFGIVAKASQTFTMNGGALEVSATNMVGYGVNSSGTATIKNGTVQVAAKGEAYGIARSGGTFTVEDGKFNISSTSATAYATNKSSTDANLIIQGGWYTTNNRLATGVAAPYQVLSLAGQSPYLYEVAEAYTLTWNLDGGSESVAGTPAGLVKRGATVTAPTVTKTGYTFSAWSPAVVSPMPSSDKTYTATWSADTYTISYDLAGGSVASPNPTSYTVESSAITLNNPTKTGYTFAGWTGTGLASATMTVTIAAGSTGNRSYTATWTATGYTITLNNQSATTAGTANISVTYNANTNLTATPAITKPTKTNYFFAGYYTETNGGGTQIIDENGSVKASVSGYTDASKNWKYAGSITLYAKWAVASVTTSSDVTTYYTTLALAMDYAKTQNNSTITILGDISGISTALTYDVAKTCTLNLNGHTVAGTADKLLTIYNSSAKFTITDNSGANPTGQLRLVRSGNANRICAYLRAGKLTLEKGTIYAENTTVYGGSNTSVGVTAVYVNSSSSYVFTMNGGKVEAKATYAARGIYSFGKTDIKGGTIIATITEGGTSNAYGVYSAANTTTITGSPTITVNAPDKAYGVYAAGNSPNSQTGAATHGIVDVQGGTFNVTATDGAAGGVSAIAGRRRIVRVTGGYATGNYVSHGKVFVSDGVFNVKGTTSVYGVYITTASYSQFTDSNSVVHPAATAYGYAEISGGKFIMTEGATYAANETAPADSLVMTGGYFSTSKTSSSKVLGNKYVAPSKSCDYRVFDLTAAQCTAAGMPENSCKVARFYTITYNKGANGTGSIDPGYKAHGDDFTLSSSTFTRTGYTQTGWSTSDGGSKAYNLGGTYTTDAAITLYPFWTINNYTVTYSAPSNGNYTIKVGSGTASSASKNADYGQTITLAATPSTGYHFTSWTITKTSDGTDVTSTLLTGSKPTTASTTFTMPDYGVTVTAVFAIDTYAISYAAGTYGSGSLSGGTKTYGVAYALSSSSSAFTRTGYTYDGWSTNAAGSSKDYNLGGSYTTNAAQTFYPHWVVTNYTISYTLNGGSVASENPTSYTVESGAITLNNPTKANYVFAGWTGTGLAEPTMTVTIPAGSTGNRSYTATWTEAVASVTVSGATTYYATLNAAWTAANSATAASTLKLLQDITVSSTEAKMLYENAQNCTLDLNGHTLSMTNTASQSPLHINSSGITFTITDGTVDKSGKLSMTSSSTSTIFGAYVENGNLVLDAGMIEVISGTKTTCGVTALTTGTFTMNGGTIHVVATNGQVGRGLYFNGTMTVNSGTIHVEAAGDGYGIFRDNSGGTATVNGGKFNITSSSGTPYITNQGNNTNVKIYGGYYNINSKLGTCVSAPKYVFRTTAADKASVGEDYEYKVTTGYVITYNKGANGTGTIASGTKAHGDDFTLSSSTFTRTGYTQTGWSESDGGAKAYELGGTYAENADITLYPFWSAQNYTLTLNNQSATTAGTTSITVTYNSNTNLTATPAITVPTKTGYTFGGYYENQGGSGKQVIAANGNVNASVSGITDASKNWIFARGGTLYAKWTQTVTLHDNNGGIHNGSLEVTYNLAYKSGTPPTREGYTAEGYYAEPACTNKVLTTAGVWVNYSGWVEDDIWVHDGESTLYTKWIEDTHTVTVAAGANGSASPASVTAGITTASGTITATPNTGYHFVNWTIPAGVTIASGSTTSASITINATADGKTITANFAANTNTAYTVKHYKQNLAGDGYDLADTDNLTGTTGASVTPAVKSYTGFTAPSTQTVTILADGSRVVTYNYTRNSYTLTWALDGGSISVAGTTAGSVKYGASLTAPTVTKTGYTFAGWSPSVPSTMPAANSTYTATWTPIAYTISYDLAGGSVASPNPTSYNIETTTFTLNNPTKTGYTFAGWTGTGLASATTTVTIAAGSTGNRSYTATWTEAGLIFTGGASTLWNDPANWTPNCVPTAAHDIIIQKPCSVNVADATAKSIVIAQNGGNTGKLIIGANQALEVTGTITKTTDGSNRLATSVSDLILESAPVGNASLIFDNSNSCQATVEMYSKATYPKNGTATWQYIGIPFAGETNAKSNYYGSWLYEWGLSGSDYGWNVIPNGGSVDPWTGYCITQREATTYEPKGTLVPTNYASLTVPAGKEMVYANSWTAPIQIQQMEAANFTNVEATIYFFNTGLDDDANGGTGTEAGTYRTVPINSVSWTGLPTKISSMQGFYVKNSSASPGTVTWQYADVVRPKNDHSITNGAMFAPKQVSEEDILETKPDVMKITVSGSRYGADLYLLAREDFTTGFDNGWDGENINEPSASPLMYALRTDGTKDAVTAIPEMEGTVIGFHAGEDKMYTFTFAYDGEEKLYLNDLQAQTYTLISAESTYSFFANETDEEARFIISGAPFDDTTTGNEHINDQSPIVRKVIIEDHVYIIRGGRIFTIDGGLVR